MLQALELVQSLEPRRLFSAVQLSVLSSIEAGSSAEIVAHDPRTQRLFVISVTDSVVSVVDVADPAHPAIVHTIETLPLGSPNSVAVHDGVVAVALEDPVSLQNPGKVAFYKPNGQFLNAVTVGALPDMLTFTPDGTKLLVANEGEPNSYGQATSVDPEGSVSIIDLRRGLGHVKQLSQADVTTVGFTQFNGTAAALNAAGARIFGPNATVAQDLEPEYVTVSDDSSTAYVTLQENNAIAEIDIASASVTALRPLGFKDHSAAGNALDGGTNDAAIRIVPRPVRGMYAPDAIASYTVGGQTYLVTANEGDAREYTGFNEQVRISATTPLDPVAFPPAVAAEIRSNGGLARLNITNTRGRFGKDADAEYEELYTFGARSFSVRAADGSLVYDSGDALERITAAAYPATFNASHDNNTFDNRSDDKGPEPEGVTLGEVDGRTYAFITLERIGGVVVYDVSNPSAPQFVQYINNRDFTAPAGSDAAGDLGPEGVTFIAAAQSPTGGPLLAVANEISGTVTLYTIAQTDDAQAPMLGVAPSYVNAAGPSPPAALAERATAWLSSADADPLDRSGDDPLA